MGIAAAPDRFALGTRTEVWDLRDMPDVAPKLEPRRPHDACYLPRNRHVTGDIAIHELAFADGRALGRRHRVLVPRDARRRPQLRARAGGRRSSARSRPATAATSTASPSSTTASRYVTALGQTDEPGGWRAGQGRTAA